MKDIPSVETLTEALNIRREIDSLENRLANIFMGAAPVTRRAAFAPRHTTAAAPRPARPAAGPAKKKAPMSPEARKKLSDAIKARWARARKAGKNAL